MMLAWRPLTALRYGQATRIPAFDKTETRSFTPPDPGEALDWILVIDDASKKYPPPGR